MCDQTCIHGDRHDRCHLYWLKEFEGVQWSGVCRGGKCDISRCKGSVRTFESCSDRWSRATKSPLAENCGPTNGKDANFLQGTWSDTTIEVFISLRILITIICLPHIYEDLAILPISDGLICEKGRERFLLVVKIKRNYSLTGC